MIQNISTSASVAALNSAANAPSKAANVKAVAAQGQSSAPVAAPVDPKAVEALKSLNVRANLERQQIAAALYDRSFTYDEGIKALKRQDAIAAYAAKIQSKAGGPTEADVAKLAKKLEAAGRQIDRLSNNKQGADLNSVAAVDGKPVDDTQANLAARINAGVKDGTLTEAEAKTLVAQQEKIAELEKGLRESNGKLTAGEQKVVLDELRKSADAINKARNNAVGVAASTLTYEQSVTNRQAALQKQLEQGVKIGALTADEAKTVQEQFEKVSALKQDSLANGSINWREAVSLSSAMNEAEAQIYDLQRNADGKKLAEVYVNQTYVDERQTGQLESITRGIDNRSLTNEEAASLLDGQKKVDSLQEQAAEGGLTRSEYLRLQSAMNDQSLDINALATNKARYTGILTATPAPTAPAPAQPAAAAPAAPAPASTQPVAPAPAAPAAPAPAAPVAAAPATPVAPSPAQPAAAPVAPVKAEAPDASTPAASPATPDAQVQAQLKAETNPTMPQINRELAQDEDKMSERLLDMLNAVKKNLADYVESARERAEAARDNAAKSGRSDDKDTARSKDAVTPGIPAPADVVVKISAYARPANPGLGAAIGSKVA